MATEILLQGDKDVIQMGKQKKPEEEYDQGDILELSQMESSANPKNTAPNMVPKPE